MHNSLLELMIAFLPTISLFSQVTVGYGSAGLDSIQYEGQEVLLNGAILQTDSLAFSDGSLGSTTATITHNASTEKTTLTYPWGVVTAQYSGGNHFNLKLTVRNNSSLTITAINLEPLWLQFPGTIQEYNGSTPIFSNNIGGPTALQTTWGPAAAVLVNDDPVKPLLIGYEQTYNPPMNSQFPLKIWTGTDPEAPTNIQPVNRPIAPGASDSYSISLYFGASNLTTAQIAAPIYASYVKTFPQTQTWTDRRAICQWVMATSHTGYPTNPRGWFNDPTVDVTTAPGISAFQARMLVAARATAANCVALNAQGVVIWDIEGEQYAQPDPTYIGSPALLSESAPEMAPIVDQVISTITAAGLRIGFTLRPQLTQSTGGVIFQTNLANPTANLSYKIAYAEKRWGATLFYVDSTVSQGAQGGGWIYNPQYFRNLQSSYPGVLLMPEEQTSGYYGASGPYDQLSDAVTGTPQSVINLYPDAFTVVYVPNVDITPAIQAELQGSVNRGDILMVRGWFEDLPTNSIVQQIYAASTYQVTN